MIHAPMKMNPYHSKHNVGHHTLVKMSAVHTRYSGMNQICHAPERMNPFDFGDPVTFSVVPNSENT